MTNGGTGTYGSVGETAGRAWNWFTNAFDITVKTDSGSIGIGEGGISVDYNTGQRSGTHQEDTQAVAEREYATAGFMPLLVIGLIAFWVFK